MRFSDDVCELVIRQARSSPATEVCGLVYGETVLTCDNVAADPAKRFEMDPIQQERAVRSMGMPDAIWHSHPRGTFRPSDDDRRVLPPDVPMMIVVPDGRVGVWLRGRQVFNWEESNANR